jgi:hypothetical protein
MNFYQCYNGKFVIYNENGKHPDDGREFLSKELIWEELPWDRCLFDTIAEVQNVIKRRRHLDKLGENRI